MTYQNDFLNARIVAFKKQLDFLHKNFHHLEEADFDRKSKPESWTAIQHLSHINAVNFFYLKQIQIPGNAPSKTKDRAISKTFLGQLMIEGLALKKDGAPKYKLPAPKIFRPLNIQHPETALKVRVVFQDLLDDIQQILKIAEAAKTLDVNKIKLATALGKWPKLNLLEALYLMEIHTQRHLIAAEKATKLIV